MTVLGVEGTRFALHWLQDTVSAEDECDVSVCRESGGMLVSFHSAAWTQRKRLLAELERAITEASGRPVVFEET